MHLHLGPIIYCAKKEQNARECLGNRYSCLYSSCIVFLTHHMTELITKEIVKAHNGHTMMAASLRMSSAFACYSSNPLFDSTKQDVELLQYLQVQPRLASGFYLI